MLCIVPRNADLSTVFLSVALLRAALLRLLVIIFSFASESSPSKIAFSFSLLLFPACLHFNRCISTASSLAFSVDISTIMFATATSSEDFWAFKGGGGVAFELPGVFEGGRTASSEILGGFADDNAALSELLVVIEGGGTTASEVLDAFGGGGVAISGMLGVIEGEEDAVAAFGSMVTK